ncbi:hypothetical protein N0V93_009157 [Gnomoniopsis smithogilvyi]|uniref:Uncharacterized protein n=1 Tax=Gnomoniopsis smithogilvyi TaxID=1191159 RepID=A0A9W9CTJ0_9PEZI|nr:hypothetical protein N0V93_009157 [Gnomoniopsis smithogilvyi]
MDGRFATIEDNASNSFEWIFDSSKTKLVEWLAHGKGLFWIQGNVDGLRLQEHNGSDIEIYCKNTILDQDSKVRPLLRPLVPEIVRRAEGVFIWVKYALQGLVTAAIQGRDEEQLLFMLDSTPTDLVEYYASVIRRIRHEDRRAAYVLFQLVRSRLEGQWLDSMDVIFAHAVWNSENFTDAQTSFKTLMSTWLVDSLKMRYRAGSFHLPEERSHRFVRNRYLVNRFGNSIGYEHQKDKIAQLSGGLLHATRPPVASKSKDMLEWHLNEQVTLGNIPSRTATAMKPLMTYFTEEDQQPVWVEPSHQTVDDFIQRPDFKTLMLGGEAEFFHESRYTWLAKVFLVQGLMYDAGRMCMLSEMTTGRSMVTFIDSVPKAVWKEMYENDTARGDKKIDTKIDSPLRFAVINGLTLYLEDALRIDTNIFNITKEELILVAPIGTETRKESSKEGRWRTVTEGEEYLQRHLDTTQLIVGRGYHPGKTRAAYLRILWIIGARTIMKDRIVLREQHYERWPMHATEAKAVLLMKLGQDPDAQLSGLKTRIVEGQWNAAVKWRPMHVAGLDFTKKLHEAGADLNGADGQGNTPLDWLLGPWDTGKGRKLRGLAHRLVEDVDFDAERARWGKIAYLIKNGGIARSTPGQVWHSFTSRHAEQLPRQSVSIVKRHGPGDPQDSAVNLGEPVSKDKDGNLSSRLTGNTHIATGFSDMVTRKEAGETVTYTNLGDDGNLLENYFEDLQLAVTHCSGLAVESSEPEIRKEKRAFWWNARG